MRGGGYLETSVVTTNLSIVCIYCCTAAAVVIFSFFLGAFHQCKSRLEIYKVA